MYVIMYLILLGIITFIFNKINDVDSNNEFLKWTKRDLLIIGSLALLAILLQILDFILPKFFVLVYGFVATIALVYVNKNREKYIQEYKKQLEHIFDSTKKLLTEKELDYSNLPFEVEKEGDKINKIIVHMKDPNKFNDANCTFIVSSLKNYFPYYDWQYNNDFPKQESVFEGQKLPPQIANWQGSDFRPPELAVLGVAGSGEVGWNFGAKEVGQSSYLYDTGERAQDIKLPSAPQCLVVGATGGGKAIWVEQEIW